MPSSVSFTEWFVKLRKMPFWIQNPDFIVIVPCFVIIVIVNNRWLSQSWAKTTIYHTITILLYIIGYTNLTRYACHRKHPRIMLPLHLLFKYCCWIHEHFWSWLWLSVSLCAIIAECTWPSCHHVGSSYMPRPSPCTRYR